MICTHFFGRVISRVSTGREIIVACVQAKIFAQFGVYHALFKPSLQRGVSLFCRSMRPCLAIQDTECGFKFRDGFIIHLTTNVKTSHCVTRRIRLAKATGEQSPNVVVGCGGRLIHVFKHFCRWTFQRQTQMLYLVCQRCPVIGSTNSVKVISENFSKTSDHYTVWEAVVASLPVWAKTMKKQLQL